MTKQKYIMALDAGTTSNRCILFNARGEMCSVAQKELAIRNLKKKKNNKKIFVLKTKKDLISWCFSIFLLVLKLNPYTNNHAKIKPTTGYLSLFLSGI